METTTEGSSGEALATVSSVLPNLRELTEAVEAKLSGGSVAGLAKLDKKIVQACLEASCCMFPDL
jgi:hypothetical protein